MSFAILSNHKIHHIYLNLALLLSYNQNCMMYYMRLCNAEYSQNPRVPTHISRVPSRDELQWEEEEEKNFGGSFLEGT